DIPASTSASTPWRLRTSRSLISICPRRHLKKENVAPTNGANVGEDLKPKSTPLPVYSPTCCARSSRTRSSRSTIRPSNIAGGDLGHPGAWKRGGCCERTQDTRRLRLLSRPHWNEPRPH